MDDIHNNYLSDINQTGTNSELSKDIIKEPNTIQAEVNHNKPWRIVIRRIVSDGRSDYENISGDQQSN